MTAWPTWDGPELIQPRTYAEFDQMYGVPASHHEIEDKVWRRSAIVECHGRTGPYPTLPGVPDRWYVQIHRVVEPYLRMALGRALVAAPRYHIKRIGGYVWRTIRHRVGGSLSPHARGCAVDIDPEDNGGHTFLRGEAPKLWSPEWRRHWPRGVPAEFVQAFRSCGFSWGGDFNDNGRSDDEVWIDVMHFEWIARDGHRSDV